MKKKIAVVVNELKFLAVNYLLGPIIGILICLFEASGRIKFQNFNTRFPIWEEKLILVSNHPSLVEPIILPLMGFPWMNFPWIFSSSRVKFSLRWLKELKKEFLLPKKLVPVSAPDKKNYFDSPPFRIFQVRNVAIDRAGPPHARISTILELKKTLDGGGRIIIFPEGTRTYKAVDKYEYRSAHGNKLGKPKDGAAWLALKSKARILPIWVEGTDKFLPNVRIPLPRLWQKMTFTIGEPFLPNGKNRREVTEEIADKLMELAAEKG